MVSYKAIKTSFQKALQLNPDGLNVNEFNRIVEESLQLYVEKERSLFKRLEYWLSHVDTDNDDKIVCADIELVRFGVLQARPSQKKNSGVSKPLSFIRSSDLEAFFKHARINLEDVNIIKRRKDTVEQRANLIDQQVQNSIESGESIQVLPLEVMTTEANIGNNRPIAMKYISIEQLVQCIANSQNASAIREYAMNYYSIRKIYDQEFIKIQKNTIRRKDEAITQLHEKIDNLTSVNTKQTDMITQQSSEIKQLLGFASDTKESLIEARQEIKEIKIKLDEWFSFSTNFARMILPMWIGSSVFKTMYDQNRATYDESNALKHMKVMFVVAFTQDDTMQVYFCCTNFADVGARLKKLYNEHRTMKMFQPKAISLISQEINQERAKLQQVELFPDSVGHVFHNKTKSFRVTLGDEDASSVYDQIVKRAHSEAFQSYQHRRNNINEDEISINPEIINHLKCSDKIFYESTLPYCQQYIDCYVCRSDDGTYTYATSGSKSSRRIDLGNLRLSNLMYPLAKIKQIFDEDRGSLEIDLMIETGLITRDNSKQLLRFSRMIAIAENVDVPAETLQRVDDIMSADTDSEDDE